MKRSVLFLVAFCAIMVSCTKNVHVPVSYTVNNEQDTTPQDVYLPATGTQYIALTVKFLGGSPTDSVTLEVNGLPNGITVSPQRSTGIPTYYYKYVYTTTNMAVGTYPVSIVGTAPGTQPQTYNFNLIVTPNDCATLYTGNMNGSNNCPSRGYVYTAAGTGTGTANMLSINNLGGYGVSTNTTVKLNPDNDSLYITSQNIGNGVTLSGNGKFTPTKPAKMLIYYTATGSATETCTATLTMQ